MNASLNKSELWIVSHSPFWFEARSIKGEKKYRVFIQALEKLQFYQLYALLHENLQCVQLIHSLAPGRTSIWWLLHHTCDSGISHAQCRAAVQSGVRIYWSCQMCKETPIFVKTWYIDGKFKLVRHTLTFILLWLPFSIFYFSYKSLGFRELTPVTMGSTSI